MNPSEQVVNNGLDLFNEEPRPKGRGIRTWRVACPDVAVRILFLGFGRSA